MDLIPNSTFRLLIGAERTTSYELGIYRVILDEPSIDRTVTVLIQPDANEEGEPSRRHRGGRKKKNDKDLRRPRKKPPVCPRRPNFDPPCRLNFDPGLVAGIA